MIDRKSSCWILIATLLSAGPMAADASDPAEPADATDPAEAAGILAWESPDGDFSWRLDGRIYLDFAVYDEGAGPMGDGAELRRARLAVKSRLWRDWAAELDLDFADEEVGIKDMWLAYTGWRNTLLKIGQHREPFSLEEVTTSRYIQFMERSLPNVLTVGRTLGASYTRWGESWRFSGGVFGQAIGSEDDNDDSEDESLGTVARLTWAPLHEPGRVLHVGVGAYRRSPDAGSGDEVDWKTESETHVEGEDFLDTGDIEDVDHFTGTGVELAAQLGRLQLQGELLELDVARFGGEPDVSFDGYYAQATWLVFGGHRPYRVAEGEFTDPVPGKRGALEISLRYSSLDLDDPGAGIAGGEGENLTLGLQYLFNRNVKLMAELVDADLSPSADADGDRPGDNSFSVAQARLLVLF